MNELTVYIIYITPCTYKVNSSGAHFDAARLYNMSKTDNRA